MSETKLQSENEAVIELMKDIDGVERIDLPDGHSAISIPKGRTVNSLKTFIDEYRTAPERIQGVAQLTTLASLIKHVNRFKNDGTGVYASDGAQPSIQVVYDYHKKDEPKFGRHRAVYKFPLSNEWNAWKAANEKWMLQGDFATFLEDRLGDVLDPSGATAGAKSTAEELGLTLASRQKLMTLSRGLTVHVESVMTNHQNLSSGEIAMVFKEQHKDEGGNALTVPNGFLLAIPVFHGGLAYSIPVRLRYKANSGKIQWCVVMINPQKSIDDAVAMAVAEIEKETALGVLMGVPEAAQ